MSWKVKQMKRCFRMTWNKNLTWFWKPARIPTNARTKLNPYWNQYKVKVMSKKKKKRKKIESLTTGQTWRFLQNRKGKSQRSQRGVHFKYRKETEGKMFQEEMKTKNKIYVTWIQHFWNEIGCVFNLCFTPFRTRSKKKYFGIFLNDKCNKTKLYKEAFN